MPATTQELISLLQLDPVEKMTFRGRNPKTWMQRTYGGQVLAQSLMAAYQTVPDDRYAHSLHAYFLRPGKVTSNLYYIVDDARDGGTFTTRHIRGEQSYREIFAASASFHRLEDGLDHHDPMPEGMPGPDDCPTMVEVMERRFGQAKIWQEWAALDTRYIADSSSQDMASHVGSQARMRIWVRTESALPDDFRLHQAILAYLSDLTLLSVSVVPHKVAFMSPQLQVASLDHVMWFHRRFRADDWLLYDMVSPSASHACGFCFGRLFQDGKLVASCAQEGLIRPVEDRPILQ